MGSSSVVFAPGHAHRASEAGLHGALVLIDGVDAHQDDAQEEPGQQSEDNSSYDLHRSTQAQYSGAM